MMKMEGTTHDKLEHAIIDAEISKKKAFEESLRRWRAEEDAMEAIYTVTSTTPKYFWLLSLYIYILPKGSRTNFNPKKCAWVNWRSQLQMQNA